MLGVREAAAVNVGKAFDEGVRNKLEDGVLETT